MKKYLFSVVAIIGCLDQQLFASNAAESPNHYPPQTEQIRVMEDCIKEMEQLSVSNAAESPNHYPPQTRKIILELSKKKQISVSFMEDRLQRMDEELVKLFSQFNLTLPFTLADITEPKHLHICGYAKTIEAAKDLWDELHLFDLMVTYNHDNFNQLPIKRAKLFNGNIKTNVLKIHY